MQKGGKKHKAFVAQHQRHPGLEFKMIPEPEYDKDVPGNKKLLNKKCIITGGDSGIGRAIAIAFAKEGASVAIIYLSEHVDAKATAKIIEEKYHQKCITVSADISKESKCKSAIAKILKQFDQVDVLVNNAAVLYPSERLEDITTVQLKKTFTTNIFSMFWITKAVLPKMIEGSCIINTTSVTAYRGSGGLIDYSATKGAIVSFTRSLSANLLERKIRVNGVAPGPVWTPLVVSGFNPDKIKVYGTDSPMKRAGQPVEVSPSYVFLASDDASYITGQFIHVNGGEIING